MIYNIASLPTIYNGVTFRSRLEARYAAFFDLLNWIWEYEPLDLPGWIPDFMLTLKCSSSFCWMPHSLLVEVKPYFNLDDFANSIACFMVTHETPIPADGIAFLGASPHISWWKWNVCTEPINSISSCVDNWHDVWIEAGNLTQWKKKAA